MRLECCLDRHLLLMRAWRAQDAFPFKDGEPFELDMLDILHGAFNARVSKEPECAHVHSA